MADIFKHIILFAKTMHPGIGGMEVHQTEFMKKCRIVVTRDNEYTVFHNNQLYLYENYEKLIDALSVLLSQYDMRMFFFNDLSFVRLFECLKSTFQNIRFVFRSGGNDIFRAPWDDDTIALNIRQRNVCTTLKSIDTMIVNSNFSYLRNVKFGIPPYKMKKIRGGVDYNKCKKNVEHSHEISHRIREKYLCGDRKILMFACRLKRFKGIVNFLESFLRYGRRNEFYLIIIGEGDRGEEIKRILNAHKNDINAIMLGELGHDDVLQYISAADFIVNTSIEDKIYFGNEMYIHTETMGRTMMESLSEGIPIIATNVGGTEELFQECKNTGYMINSFKELPMVLTRILDDNEIPKHKIVTPDYSWQAIFDSYKSMFEERNKDVLVLDLDDTLINSDADIYTISRIIKENKHLFFLIINTARFLTPELKRLADYLHADYLIAANGMNIIRYDNNILWDENTGLIKDTIKQTDKILKCLKHDFPTFEIKKTHPHLIQIKGSKEFKTNIVKTIDIILHGTNFFSIHHGKMMKIISKSVSKETALYFVLKDLYYSKVYGAGNSLNDYLFIRDVDYGWMASEYSTLFENHDNIIYFEKDEVGVILLNRIISKIKTKSTIHEHNV